MTDQQQKVKGIVDIVFLLDVTGSMQPCIDALKTNISTFIDTLTTKNANNENPVKDWRAKAVGFRDFEADATPYEDNPFVRDASALKAQLNGLKADGGGDEPESLLDALFKVSSMDQSEDNSTSEDANKWRHRHQAARVVVVFTDALYKERMTIPEAKGGTFEDLKNVIHPNRIVTSIFAPDLPIFQGTLAALDRNEFNAIKLEGKTPQEALAAFTSDQNNFRETLKQLAASVSKSSEVPVL
jgi:hypothetical protein